MDIIFLIFFFVYFGMFLGEIPGLALDRTGIALLGAIAVVIFGKMNPGQAWDAVDVPTISLLFGLMIVSAQFRLGGFYVQVTRYVANLRVGPPVLLMVLIFVSGGLSSVLANDIVCLAMTPILVEICAQRSLNPLPFLLGLACSANVGSAATLIGNPQNMLIGQVLDLSFAGYLLDALVPSLLGLVATWLIIFWMNRNKWERKFHVPASEAPPFNVWQTCKGIIILVLLLIGFLFTSWPREVLALGAAGIILSSRRMASRNMLSLVDWQLLVMFVSLFIVNEALAESGVLQRIFEGMQEFGIQLDQPGWLFGITVILSNLVSNVPAVMLLLPVATHPLGGAILALASTLAGNLFVVGSIANMIVIEKARDIGVIVSWRDHIVIGLPVTVVTLGLAVLWLLLRISIF